MLRHAADRLTLFVAAFGAMISLAALLIAGQHAGVSAGAGAVLALVNLLVLRTLVLRVIQGDIHTKLPLLALVFLKMGLFVALVFLAITRGWVEPIAFTVGLSSLVVGLITGALAATRSGSSSEC